MPDRLLFHESVQSEIATNMKSTILVGCTALGLVTNVAVAQTLGIDWFTIDGGGRVSSGGPYRLSGTMGQPDAGISSGGLYSLGGGFLGDIKLIQAPGLPNLEIEDVNGSIRLFWPLSSDAWLLEQSPAVTGTWSQAVFLYSTNANTISASIQISEGKQFYRLRHK